MFTKKIGIITLAFIFSLPVLHAAEWELLQADLDTWEGIIKSDEREQSMQNADRDFQQDSGELFPEYGNPAEESTNVLEQKRNERTQEFVTIEAGGAFIVLTDVPRSTWFAPYVRDIAEYGLISGYRDAAGNPTGLFGPADNVTIEQVAKVLVTAIGMDPDACAQKSLNITASGSWSAPYFACAEGFGLPILGDGLVDARRNATRAEVIVALLHGFSVEPDTGTGASFTDVTSTMQFGTTIAQAKKDGIISGYTDASGEATGFFGPADPITRAEFAKIMTVGLQVYGTNPRIRKIIPVQSSGSTLSGSMLEALPQ